MPTTAFAQHHHQLRSLPLDAAVYEDLQLHYLQHPKGIQIVSEHDYNVHSLVPSPPCDARVNPFSRPQLPRRVQSRISKSARPKPQRPPMAALASSYDANMALGGAPGSPPDLSNSKSSRSSSFHSSHLSDVMAPHDLAHFEDINLDDSQATRSSVSSSRSLTHSHASHSFRDLTGAPKSRFPTLNTQLQGRQQSQLHAPPRSSRRGFTSPSVPSLGTMSTLTAPGRRSRSSSPANASVTSAPRTLSRRSSRNLDVSPSQAFNRRQSWQHAARKTAKELEAECDDDDDEVPEDLMIPNVPISPRPVSERSPVPSACNSPPELSPASSRAASVRSVSPRERSPSSPKSANSDNLPPQPLSRQRTNTWEDTYLALDPDAKKVTEALEEYQTNLEREQEVKRQQPNRSRPTSQEEKRKSTKPSLPPLRKSDPLIDPFQPSSEKEKHLSRTRPSWLPPKNPAEEKKHLKEYAKIQARVQEAMKEQARKEEEEKLAREQVGQKKASIWQNDILPNFKNVVANTATRNQYRQLWWTGIPPKVRGTVWKTGIGNELEITETTFKVALETAKTKIREQGDRAFDGKVPNIVENTKKVFPELKIFAPKSEDSEEQPFHQDLVDVCLAYHSYRPDVDSHDGVHHLAGLLLLNMSVPDTFICLGNLLNRPLPLSFLINDYNKMTVAYDITLSTLAKKAPTLARRLEELRVEPRDYLRPMFSSLFCDRLPIEHAARLMDVYVIEGDKIPPRAAVGFLNVRENKLYQGNAEDVLRHMNAQDMKLHADEFMNVVYEAGKIG